MEKEGGRGPTLEDLVETRGGDAAGSERVESGGGKANATPLLGFVVKESSLSPPPAPARSPARSLSPSLISRAFDRTMDHVSRRRRRRSALPQRPEPA